MMTGMDCLRLPSLGHNGLLDDSDLFLGAANPFTGFVSV